MIKDGIIYNANVGDSRSIAFTSDKKTYSLSYDHKPNIKREYDRITNAKGTVENNRVLVDKDKGKGGLAISRALGDFDFKMNSEFPADKQQIIPHPDTTIFDTASLDFVVIASDGIWDCLKNEECSELLSNAMQK